MDFDEIKIEEEKLTLEREKLQVERERLEAAKERLHAQENAVRSDSKGRLYVSFPNLILVSIICTLLGGILGAFSVSTSAERREKERLRDLMQTLAAAGDREENASSTNAVKQGSTPNLVRMLQPRGAHAGVSLVVIQGVSPLSEKTDKGNE